MRRLRTIALLAAVTATCVAVPAAEAHVEVKSTSPKKNRSASKSIGSVSVTFTGPLRRGTLKVTGPGGKVVSVGHGGRDPRKITRLVVELKSGLAAGSYRARWTIKAADGHEQDGSWRFRLR